MSTTSGKYPCRRYVQHLFLHNDKCINCGFSEEEHVAAAQSRKPSAAAAAAAAGSSDDDDDSVRMKPQDIGRVRMDSAAVAKCTHYTPHAWIFDRCRDCGRPESDHLTSSGLELDPSGSRSHANSQAAPNITRMPINRYVEFGGANALSPKSGDDGAELGSADVNVSSSTLKQVMHDFRKTRKLLSVVQLQELRQRIEGEMNAAYEELRKIRKEELGVLAAAAKVGKEVEAKAKERYQLSIQNLEKSFEYHNTGLQEQLEAVSNELKEKGITLEDDEKRTEKASSPLSDLPSQPPVEQHSPQLIKDVVLQAAVVEEAEFVGQIVEEAAEPIASVTVPAKDVAVAVLAEEVTATAAAPVDFAEEQNPAIVYEYVQSENEPEPSAGLAPVQVKVTGLTYKKIETPQFSSADASDVADSLYGDQIPLAVRACDLVQTSWLAENDSLVGLFGVDGGAPADGSRARFLEQTELVRDASDPQYEKKFLLKKTAESGKQYVLRVYDVDPEAPNVSADQYLGMTAFALDELTSASGPIQLPLVHPTHAATNAQLDKAMSSLIIQSHKSASTSDTAAAIRVYTRLAPPLSLPSVPSPSTLYELELSAASLPAKLSDISAVVSLFARTPQYLDFRYLGHSEKTKKKTFVIGGGDEVTLKVALHDRRGLKLSTARLTEAALSDTTSKQFIGSVSFSFSKLSAALEASKSAATDVEFKLDGLSDLSGASVRITVSKRAPFSAPVAAAVSAAQSEGVRERVIDLTRRLLLTGGVFKLYSQRDATDKAGRVDEVNVWLGKDLSRLFCSLSSAGRVEDDKDSLPVLSIFELYGGKQKSPFYTESARAQAELPQSERCLSIIGADGGQLHLEFPTWQLRDAWAFALLQLQKEAAQAANRPPCAWIPTPSTSFVTGPVIITGGKEKREEKTGPAPLQTQEQPSSAAPSQGTPSHNVAPVLNIIPPTPTAHVTSDKPIVPFSPVNQPAASPSGSANAATASSATPTAAGVTSASSSSGTPPGKTRSGTGASSTKDMEDVLQRLERVFESGKNFVRHLASRDVPVLLALWLKKTTVDGKTRNTLCWARENDRTVHDTRAIAFENIACIVLHKQTAVFRRSCFREAPASACFSVVGKDGHSLHLQAFNDRDAETWAFGLASLLKQAGVKPKLYQPGQYEIENDKRLQLESSEEGKETRPEREREVQLRDVKSVGEQLSKVRVSVELSVKCRGLPNKFHQNIVCAFAVDEKSEKLAYLGQSEKVSKTGNPDFRKKFVVDYSTDPNRKLRFNVYDLAPTSKVMEDNERIGSAVVLLREVVDHHGIDFVYSLSHEDKSKQEALAAAKSTVSIQCIAKIENPA